MQPGLISLARECSGTTSSSTLFPQLETSTAPLDESEKYLELKELDKQFIKALRDCAENGDLLQDVADTSILPLELLSNSKRSNKPKVDPLKRLKEMSNDEAEDEEEPDDEEPEDEETAAVDDEEDDAGGDYIVSHFDNGEGYEDNDDDGDDMTSMI